MKIGEALKKGLLKVKHIDDMDWIVEQNGSRVIGYVSGIEDTEVSITESGIVTAVFL
ncbi:MAG: hypothetical protein ACOVQ4_12235 [Flectobacillus sp.]|uniref:hypothetical protein n=1 Tax=Flectobacillus sp. TaxID=50419 RepID=UPI003B99D70E